MSNGTIPPKICNRCNGPFTDRNGVAACDCHPNVGLVRKALKAPTKAAPAPTKTAAAAPATVMPRDRSYWANLSAEARTDIIIRAVEILSIDNLESPDRLERLRRFLVEKGHVTRNDRVYTYSSWIR